MKVLMFILGVFLIPSFSASASALANIPDQKYWSLATDDIVKYNTVTKAANAEVYLSSVDGTLVRAIATTNASRIMTLAKTAVKGAGWIGAAIAVAELSYDGYRWYKSKDTLGFEYYGSCDAYPAQRVTLGACVAASSKYVSEMYNLNPRTNQPIHYQVSETSFSKDSYCSSSRCSTVDGETISYSIVVKYQSPAFSIPDGINLVTKWNASAMGFNFYVQEKRSTTKKENEPITDEQAETEIMAQLVNVSSRQAFADGSMPYPLAGLFTNEDLAIDPTYSPQANITTQNLNDYITKYNNGLLQSTDPSAENYVTPSQYAYVKSQAEQAAATAANPNATSSANNTNPLQGMEQPITQAQYDDSNSKTATAEKTAINAVAKPELSGLLTPIDDFTKSISDVKTQTAPTINTPSAINYGTGTCWNPSIDSLAGTKFNLGVYCDNYSSIAHPILYWFIWACTGIYLWHFGRQTISARV